MSIHNFLSICNSEVNLLGDSATNFFFFFFCCTNCVTIKVDHYLEDLISQLPDDILVLILSFLTIKEATVISVLSSRWTYLWTYHTRLDFDYKELYDDKETYIYGLKNYETKRLRYVNWVNRVVQLYSGSTIEEFCVRFDLGKDSESDVNKWLKFALSKRIQRLELDLKGVLHHDKKPYIFSYRLLKLLHQSKGTSSNFCGMRPSTFVGFNTLKALFLKNVNVSGEVLEYFLSSCPVLEQMGVHFSKHLVNLKVVGPSLVLKQLEICHCRRIKSIEIRNVNLVSFTVLVGGKISFLLENVPMLVDLNIDGRISRSLTDVFAQGVGFNALKAIFLKHVNVSGEVLEYFLSSCPVLERMGVHFSEDLINLKVVGPSLALKQLEICHCWRIKSIEIRNVNLVSLTVMGGKISFLLENVPMLVDLNIDWRISRSLAGVFALFACCLSQLEILSLDTSDSEVCM
ncbi:F-box/LRR-repeat protein At3g03360-like [Cornus florida]|uniref:F-box/LRR-repeat protein At3g03360-like n=1 Tax=Cornus florida TaxID=4283 RepID=UPI0028A0BDE6|nr:F-box/LRR-repeat protein At3g03360-like [Cornus florida]